MVRAQLVCRSDQSVTRGRGLTDHSYVLNRTSLSRVQSFNGGLHLLYLLPLSPSRNTKLMLNFDRTLGSIEEDLKS